MLDVLLLTSTYLALWLLCGLFAGRISYVVSSKLHGGEAKWHCQYHFRCDPGLHFWLGPLAFVGWVIAGVLTTLHKGGMWFITRPTREQRERKHHEEVKRWQAIVDDPVPVPCNNPLVHSGHWYGEMNDEWCNGVERQYPKGLEWTPDGRSVGI